jgi:hypothetical protein
MKQRRESFQFNPEGEFVLRRSKKSHWWSMGGMLLLALYILIQYNPLYGMLIILGVLLYLDIIIKDVIKINKKGIEFVSGFHVKWEEIDSYDIEGNVFFFELSKTVTEQVWDLSPYSFDEDELRAAIDFYSQPRPYSPTDDKKLKRKELINALLTIIIGGGVIVLFALFVKHYT